MFLDEPTNHLDIYMRESLTQALAAYTGTLLLVTHDRYLMQTLGCPIMYLEDGKATFYPSFAPCKTVTPVKPRSSKDRGHCQKAGIRQGAAQAPREVRARLKKVESEIEELGAHIVELENEITTPRSCATICCCATNATSLTTPASTSRSSTTSGKSWPRSRKPLKTRANDLFTVL